MKRLLVVAAVALTLAGSGPAPMAARAAAVDIDTLMAPVALYPDQLLAQMLLCASTNPSMIGTLSEWLRSQTLKGSELQDAAAKSGFEASFAALALFPEVVDWMAGRPEWTAQVGSAFKGNRSAVFDSIQRLRAKAQSTGTLKSNKQQQVETKTTSGGQQVIVIEPANPQIVYVPQYNPQTVYTTAPSTTVVIQEDDDDDDAAAAMAAGMIGFTAGVAISAAFDNNYYYGPYGWHGGAYMYNDAWDDYYDHREDARDDWQDHREDMYENRSDRAEDARENRSERVDSTQQQRTERRDSTQQQRTDRQQNRTSTTAATTNSGESRGFSRDGGSVDRSGTKSDAFSNYGSGKSERAASQRGQKSRSSSARSSGSRRR